MMIEIKSVTKSYGDYVAIDDEIKTNATYIFDDLTKVIELLKTKGKKNNR